MANIAVGAFESEELESSGIIKKWLRREEEESVGWYAIPSESWIALEWILSIPPIAYYSHTNSDSGVLVFEGDLASWLLRDLGGDDLDKLLRAVGWSDRLGPIRDPKIMWVSYDPGALIDRIIADPATEGRRFWFSTISSNTLTLLLRRLSRPVQEQPDQKTPEAFGVNDEEATG